MERLAALEQQNVEQIVGKPSREGDCTQCQPR